MTVGAQQQPQQQVIVGHGTGPGDGRPPRRPDWAPGRRGWVMAHAHHAHTPSTAEERIRARALDKLMLASKKFDSRSDRADLSVFRDKSLTREEFRVQMRKSFGINLSHKESRFLCSVFDLDGDGSIDGAEFSSLFFRVLQRTREETKKKRDNLAAIRQEALRVPDAAEKEQREQQKVEEKRKRKEARKRARRLQKQQQADQHGQAAEAPRAVARHPPLQVPPLDHLTGGRGPEESEGEGAEDNNETQGNEDADASQTAAAAEERLRSAVGKVSTAGDADSSGVLQRCRESLQGRLTVAELRKQMQYVTATHWTEEDAEAFVACFAKDDNGRVCSDDVRTVVARVCRIEHRFQKFKDGYCQQFSGSGRSGNGGPGRGGGLSLSKTQSHHTTLAALGAATSVDALHKQLANAAAAKDRIQKAMIAYWKQTAVRPRRGSTMASSPGGKGDGSGNTDTPASTGTAATTSRVPDVLLVFVPSTTSTASNSPGGGSPAGTAGASAVSSSATFSASEFRNRLRQSGLRVALEREEADALVAEFDKRGRGRISGAEFVKWLMATAGPGAETKNKTRQKQQQQASLNRGSVAVSPLRVTTNISYSTPQQNNNIKGNTRPRRGGGILSFDGEPTPLGAAELRDRDSLHRRQDEQDAMPGGAHGRGLPQELHAISRAEARRVAREVADKDDRVANLLGPRLSGAMAKKSKDMLPPRTGVLTAMSGARPAGAVDPVGKMGNLAAVRGTTARRRASQRRRMSGQQLVPLAHTGQQDKRQRAHAAVAQTASPHPQVEVPEDSAVAGAKAEEKKLTSADLAKMLEKQQRELLGIGASDDGVQGSGGSDKWGSLRSSALGSGDGSASGSDKKKRKSMRALVRTMSMLSNRSSFGVSEEAKKESKEKKRRERRMAARNKRIADFQVVLEDATRLSGDVDLSSLVKRAEKASNENLTVGIVASILARRCGLVLQTSQLRALSESYGPRAGGAGEAGAEGGDVEGWATLDDDESEDEDDDVDEFADLDEEEEQKQAGSGRPSMGDLLAASVAKARAAATQEERAAAAEQRERDPERQQKYFERLVDGQRLQWKLRNLQTQYAAGRL